MGSLLPSPKAPDPRARTSPSRSIYPPCVLLANRPAGVSRNAFTFKYWIYLDLMCSPLRTLRRSSKSFHRGHSFIITKSKHPSENCTQKVQEQQGVFPCKGQIMFAPSEDKKQKTTFQQKNIQSKYYAFSEGM
jgi:hypothetical protein